jgi:hypothetical protein
MLKKVWGVLRKHTCSIKITLHQQKMVVVNGHEHIGHSQMSWWHIPSQFTGLKSFLKGVVLL